MPIPTYTLRCLFNRKIARDIFEFSLEKPKEFDFRAGQFVLFHIPLLSHPEDIQTRAFSIASSPKEEELLFVAKMREGGRASLWIEHALKEGTIVLTQGPFGVFTLDREDPKEWVLIGTSTGVAPFRSQLHTFLPDETRRIDLIIGARSEEDVFWKESWDTLSQQHGNLFVHFALSQPTAQWKGHIGRVQTLAPLIVKDFSRKKVYVCGNPAMTMDLKKLCLETWGMEKRDVHLEGYI